MIASVAGFAAVTGAVASIGGLFPPKPVNQLWYRALAKPRFTPSTPVIVVAWTVLYTLGAVSGARVWHARATRPGRIALGLWGTQLVLNGAFTPLFFGAHLPGVAMADLVATGVSAAAYARAAGKVDRAAAWLMVPYLGWLACAGLVNAGILMKNRGLRRWLLVRTF